MDLKFGSGLKLKSFGDRYFDEGQVTEIVEILEGNVWVYSEKVNQKVSYTENELRYFFELA